MFNGTALAHAMWRKQVLFTHDAKNPFAADLDALDEAKPSPDLAMTFAGKKRSCEVLTDKRKKFVITYRSLWATLQRSR